jgi:dipeptidyl aminopeptidase/acylaminoacyl peptidase
MYCARSLYRARISAALITLAFLTLAAPVNAQEKPTIRDFISAPIPTALVSARRVDRIAWLAYDKGIRNVYTASGPAFRPRQVTPFRDDDGIELGGLKISDDGSMLIFVRGLNSNGQGWVANATADPDGQERAIWAARASGGDAWRVTEGGSADISPDGKWILFARDGQIYRASTQKNPRTAMDRGEEPFIRAWGTNSGPLWSPDGLKIVFLSNRGDHSYLALYDVPSRTVSYIDPGVDRDASPTWSPDGKQIAFTRRPGLSFGANQQRNLDNAAQGGRGGRGGGGRGGGGGGRGGRGGAGAGDSTPPNPARAIPGMFSSALPGGHTLALMVADVASGNVREFWRPGPSDQMFGNIGSITWAGSSVMFSMTVGNEESPRRYSIAINGGNRSPVQLTTTTGLVEGNTSVALSSDGHTLFYATNAEDIDRRHIWSVPTSGGTPKQLSTGDGIETWPSPLASGKGVAVLYADAKHPMAPAIVPAEGGKARIITTLPSEFPLDAHVAPEAVTLTAADGFEFYNQIFVPKGIAPGERRPAMVFVHGGPARQMLLGYHYMSFYHLFYGINQWLQSQGYVVISVNYRSGIGYGRAFRNPARRGANGNSEYQDVLAAAKYLQSRPDVDPSRVGIWGLSYGGLLTAQALARNSDVFIAGVDLAGVHLQGSSLEAGTVSFQSSSISEIGKWKAPVLLVHGDDDRNVNFSQTVGLVQLLRAHGIYHELIVLPDDVHETLLESRWHNIWDAFEKFVTRFVWNKEAAPAR